MENKIVKFNREYESARSLAQHLTFEAVSAYFARKEIPFGKKQMRSLNMIGEDGTYTHLPCCCRINVYIPSSRQYLMAAKRPFSVIAGN